MPTCLSDMLSVQPLKPLGLLSLYLGASSEGIRSLFRTADKEEKRESQV